MGRTRELLLTRIDSYLGLAEWWRREPSGGIAAVRPTGCFPWEQSCQAGYRTAQSLLLPQIMMREPSTTVTSQQGAPGDRLTPPQRTLPGAVAPNRGQTPGSPLDSQTCLLAGLSSEVFTFGVFPLLGGPFGGAERLDHRLSGV